MKTFSCDVNGYTDLKEFGRDIGLCYIKDLSNKYGIIYAVAFDDGVIKVGKTQDPKNRLYNAAKSSGRTPVSAYACFTDNYSSVEQSILKALSKYNLNGEFFKCSIDKIVKAVGIYSVDVHDSEIEERNNESLDNSERGMKALVNFVGKVNTISNKIDKYEVRIMNNMNSSKVDMWGDITGGYGDVNFESLPYIYDNFIDIDKLNALMISNSLFCDDYTPSQESLDNGLLRNVKINVSDVGSSFKTYNATMVTSKGLEVIGEILLNEFRQI